MTVQELEIWKAEERLRSDECPSCGVEPRDMMDYRFEEIKCPNCKNKYGKTFVRV